MRAELQVELGLWRQVMEFCGTVRGLQVVGFCRLWAKLDNRPLREIVEQIEEAGLSRSGAYRYVQSLQQLRDHLAEKGRDPGTVEDLAHKISALGD